MFGHFAPHRGTQEEGFGDFGANQFTVCVVVELHRQEHIAVIIVSLVRTSMTLEEAHIR